MDNPSKAPLVALGDNCIDVYVQTGEKLVGGNAVNVAVQWALAGRRSSYVGAVGSDDHGARVEDALVALGVDTEGLLTLPGPTGVTEIEIAGNGERSLVSEDLGVSADLRLSDADVDAIGRPAWAHCATLEGFRAVAERFARHGVPVSMDFSTRFEFDGLEHLEVAFYSCRPDEVDAARDVVARAIAGGARIAVATCGPSGSVARSSGDAGGLASVPAVEITPVDTLGAGDSYAASFIIARLDGLDVVSGMRIAAQAAAVTCGHRGGWPQEAAIAAERAQ
jgi:fructoselysine 6-kinase